MIDDSPLATDIIERIAARYANLTKSERRVADYLRQNRDEVAFLSAGEIARRLDLSEATMVRFARNLGFDNYPAMRAMLQENFLHRVTHSTRLRSRIKDLREAGDIFEKLVASEIDYMTEALQTVDRDALHTAVELLRTHRRIFVFGLGPSISLVDLMQIRLVRFGHHVIPLTTAGREIVEPLLLLNKDDLVVVICFFNLTPALQLVLDYADQVDCPVIMLTDTLGTIVGDKADVVLAAKRGPLSEFHSLVVPMTIINSLLLALASEDQEDVVMHLDKLDQVRQHLKKISESE